MGGLLLRNDLSVIAADESACALIGAPAPASLADRALPSITSAGDAAALDELRQAVVGRTTWLGTLHFTFTRPEVALQCRLQPGAPGGAALLHLAAYDAPHDPSAASDAPLRARIDALEAIAQLDSTHAARAALQALDRTVPFDWAAVVRFRPEDGGGEAVAVYPSPMAGIVPGLRWQPLSAADARLRDTGQPALDNDVVFEGPGALAVLAGYGFRARLLIPLHASDRVAGYVILLRHRPRTFSPTEGVRAESMLRPLGPGVGAPMHGPAITSPLVPTPGAEAAPIAAGATAHGSEMQPRLSILGELVAGVAHELNNPLTAILGYAQILDSLEGTERDEAIRTIEAEAVRASRIVRNLLSFSRQRPPERRAVDVERILRRVIDLRRYALEMDDIQIVPRFSHVPEVLADESQLEEAFLHLLVNAQQALEQRGGQVTITTTRHEDAVRIAFADSGEGIPEALRGRVFEPFFTTREVGSGQGMGLAIVHGVVTAHGGRAWAEAAPEGGAQIVLELPVTHEGTGPRGPVPLDTPR